MRLLHKMTVRQSIWLFVGLASAGAALQGVSAWHQAREADRVSERLRRTVHAVRAAGRVDMLHDSLRSSAYAARLAGKDAPAERQQGVRTELAEFAKAMETALDELCEHAESAELRDTLASARPQVQDYVASAQRLVEAELTDPSSAEPMRSRFDAAFKRLESELEGVSEKVAAASEALAAERQAMVDRDGWMTPLVALGTIALVMALGLGFARRLLALLGAEPAELRGVASAISRGELGAELHASHEDSVAGAMVTMRDHLRGAVASIRGGAEQVAAGSHQMREDSERLAERTDHQSASLQQASASVQQMEAAVKQTADHAQVARELAASAASVAAETGAAARQAVATMTEIQSSSKVISDIVSVIDGIAFRTNILALNAAVEAARAGEQGRGFAVVATEVRALAQRSAGAAREIKGLIGESVARVDQGNRIVLQAGETMERLVESVGRINGLIGEITVSAREQAQGISELSESVASIDEATRQNAAMVGQSTAAAAALEHEAQLLHSAVTLFSDEAVAA